MSPWLEAAGSPPVLLAARCSLQLCNCRQMAHDAIHDQLHRWACVPMRYPNFDSSHGDLHPALCCFFRSDAATPLTWEETLHERKVQTFAIDESNNDTVIC